jgi:uncharacterized membrane protein
MNPDFDIQFMYYPYLICLFIIGYLIPLFSRATIVFGVKIPSDQLANPEIVQLKENYKRYYLMIMIPFVILLFFAIYSYRNNLIGILGIFLYTYLIASIYVHFNSKAKQIKAGFIPDPEIEIGQNIVIDTNFRKGKYLVTWLWFIPSFIVVTFNFLFTYINYNKVPAVIADRFSMSGKEIHFISKTFIHVFTLPFTSAFTLAIFVGIYFIIKRAKQQINPEFPETTKLQDRSFRYLWSGYMIILAFALSVYFLLISLHVDRLLILSNQIFTVLIIGLPLLIIISAIILGVKTGQSGSRLKVNIKEQRTEVGDINDDDYWKLGMLYFNPKDPSIFVPKRIGIGWTLNFGHPVSFIMLLAILVIPLVVVSLLK